MSKTVMRLRKDINRDLLKRGERPLELERVPDPPKKK